MATNYIYFHICTINHWKNVVAKLCDKIINSTLIKHVKEIRVSLVGRNIESAKELLTEKFGEKIKIIIETESTNLFERPLLERLRQDSEKEEFNVLYIHSKGVFKGPMIQIDDWIDFLVYYNIENYPLVLKELETSGTCGCNLVDLKGTGIRSFPTNSYHYSGNFWWATSNYIKTLPIFIGKEYIEPELWIGQGKGLMTCLFKSGLPNGWGHYKYCFPREKYFKRINKRVIKRN